MDTILKAKPTAKDLVVGFFQNNSKKEGGVIATKT